MKRTRPNKLDVKRPRGGCSVGSGVRAGADAKLSLSFAPEYTRTTPKPSDARK